MMMMFLNSTVYWAILISLGSYYFGCVLQRKTRLIIFNPLLLSTLLTIGFLLAFEVNYNDYFEKADLLYYLLTPATVCLAIPLYEKLDHLKSNLVAILIGVFSGVIACLTSIVLFAILFQWTHTFYVTILPKSITAAMAMGVSEELGGISSLTVPIVIMTGITGNIIAERVCKLFCIQDPIAKGIAIGTASHVMGTAKAIEMGEIEGAMSGLAIAVSGVMTVILATLFSNFIN